MNLRFVITLLSKHNGVRSDQIKNNYKRREKKLASIFVDFFFRFNERTIYPKITKLTQKERKEKFGVDNSSWRKLGESD